MGGAEAALARCIRETRDAMMHPRIDDPYWHIWLNDWIMEDLLIREEFGLWPWLLRG